MATAHGPTADRTLAIVGAGFCGTMAAVWFMRSALPAGTRVLLIERGPAFGRGVAYRKGPAHWLLNVPAERMSPFADRPTDFLDWARRRDPSIEGGDYLPRTLYGDYLESLLADAARAANGARLERMSGEVVSIVPAGAQARLSLADGTTVLAERVVLALGNPLPADPHPALASLPAYVHDPWNPDWIEALPPKARVVLLGTSLTTLDVALSVAQARPKSRILAFSRHGLLPREQRQSGGANLEPLRSDVLFPIEVLMRGPLSQRVRKLRALARRWSEMGGDWRAVVQRTRDAFPAIWRSLEPAERTRFMRHLRAWWDVHRHRAPQRTLERFHSHCVSGQITVGAARLVDVWEENGRATLCWRPRGAKRTLVDHADVIVNCSGPDVDVRRSRSPLVKSLLAQGLALPDPLNLGWQTADDGRLLDAGGCASSLLYYVGPLLRGREWEATAVPELRQHVERTVAAVLKSLEGSTAQAEEGRVLRSVRPRRRGGLLRLLFG